MHVRVLGAHQLESKESRLTSLLVDGVLAIDAGSLSSTLTIPEQEEIGAVLITHHHFDHTRDLLTLGINTDSHTTDVYSTAEVLDSLSSNLVNGAIYPRFTDGSTSSPPSLRFNLLEPGELAQVCGYTVLPLPVPHGPPTIGYQVKDARGKAIFYTGDTGRGCSSVWSCISPDLLLIDVTLPNRLDEPARKSGHLTPLDLLDELQKFRSAKGYLPKVLATHLNPRYEEEIRVEVQEVAQRLDADVSLAYEGLEMEL
ncbi:MAG: MBL fold metallo-hydrolase [Dehalococcoidia bacterium]